MKCCLRLAVLTFFIGVLSPFVLAGEFAQNLIPSEELDAITAEIQKKHDADREQEEEKNAYQPSPIQAKEVLSKAQKALKKLDDYQVAYYNNFFDKVKMVNGLPDINDVDTMKAYLAAYKLLKYNLNPPMNTFTNRFNEDSALLGTTSIAFREVYKKYQKDAAYLWLEKVLYTADHFRMLPIEHRQKVEELSDVFMKKRLKERFGWSEEKIKLFLQETETDFRSVTFCYNTDNEWNNWNVHVVLLNDGIYDEENKKLFPRSLCALHELLHVQETFPGQPQIEDKHLVELSTTFQDIVLSDIIYKQLNNIDLFEVVSYPQKEQAVDYGELAVFLHKMIQKYGVHDITPLLLKPEVEQYIHDLYNANK